MREPLFDFLGRYSKKIDIFCFQEVFAGSFDEKGNWGSKDFEEKVSIFRDLEKILPNHFGILENLIDYEFGFRKGLAIFVKKNIPIEGQGEVTICDPDQLLKPKDTLAFGNLQYIKIAGINKPLTIGNVHGLFNGPSKNDDPDRLEQSRRIKGFFDNVAGAKILCGDFNLWPDTESLKLLENDMRNLIKEYNITSTRSNFFKFPNKYADYVLVSPEIKVIDFKVIGEEISDHLPVYLEFE